MIRFEWLWAFLALPLPLLVRWVLPRAESTGHAALRVPHGSLFAVSRGHFGSSFAWRPRVLFAALAWTLLVVAVARPQWAGEMESLPLSGRDLLLAVDISGSMETRDFFIDQEPLDRLTATKLVAGDFIKRRVGDRVGLILFGSRPYLQTPLTFDRATVSTLLDEAVVGLAGKDTAIGSAVGLAIRKLQDRPAGDRVLILLTDGANTAGELDPLQAAKLAADAGLRIHTIGVGADELLLESLFGARRVNPSADLDEETLQRIASATGGQYFRARDSRQLEEIYALLDEIEPVPEERAGVRPVQALYPWPLALAMLIALLLTIAESWSGRLR